MDQSSESTPRNGSPREREVLERDLLAAINILEAFFHARFMLEMAVRYADLEEPPQMLPSGWAALLYLSVVFQSCSRVADDTDPRPHAGAAETGGIGGVSGWERPGNSSRSPGRW